MDLMTKSASADRLGAEWYIQLYTVRVAVDLWEVALNDLKQFARVDLEKQGAPNMNLEEHLVLKETGWRDYHLQRHAGTGQIDTT